VFDDDTVLENRDLGVARALMRGFGADLVADDHHPLDGFAPGQELGLAQDGRSASARIPAVTAALPLGFQPGRPTDSLDLVVAAIGVALVPSRGALVHDGVRRIVRRSRVVAVAAGAGLAAPTAAAPAGAVLVALVTAAVLVALVLIRLVGILGILGILGVDGVAVVGVVAVLLSAATASLVIGEQIVQMATNG